MPTNLALLSYTALSRVASRTLGARAAEIFNWKDYGAIGDGGNHPLSDRFGSLLAAQVVYAHATALTQQIDWAAIQGAVNAMYDAGGGTCYGPPGHYNAGSSQIRLDSTGTPATGTFIGAGKGATIITGTLDSDFLVNQPHNGNSRNSGGSSMSYIGDMSITNFSVYIGTGALRYAQSNLRGILSNMTLGGMCSLDMGWNIFNCTVMGVDAYGAGATVSAYGSIGMINSGANVYGWREAAQHEIGMIFNGLQSMDVGGISFEITPVGLVLGQFVYFATNCTITGADGSKVLTVSGTLSPPAADTAIPIQSGDQIVCHGVDPRVNPHILVNAQLTDTSVAQGGHEQGTYSLTGADGVTLNTPQPITIRRRGYVGNYNIRGVQTEGANIGIYVMASANGTISDFGIGGVINQGVSNEFGGIASGTYTCSPVYGVYIESAGALTLNDGGVTGKPCKAAIGFAQFSSLNGITLNNVIGDAIPPAVTDANAFIDDGAGTTLVTSASTSSSSNVLHFAAGTIPGSVVNGVPVLDITTVNGANQNNFVTAVNNGAGTVTLSKNVTAVNSGDTIKFCIPSGVAGGVMTVQNVSGNLIGRCTDILAPGLDNSIPAGGMALSGAGISTGSNTPMIRDMIGGWNGGYYTQYTLIKADRTSVSLNVGPEVITLTGGRGWGVDNLTDLSGIQGSTKAGLHILPNCNNDSIVAMHFADLPGQAGVTTNIRGPLLGDSFIIVDGRTAAVGDTAQGGASQKLEVTYNASVWKVTKVLA